MQYIVDALEECLTCNNSKCNHQQFLQTDCTARTAIVSTQLILPWPNITLVSISSILILVFVKDVEMMFLYYGNMVPLLSLLSLDYLNTMDRTDKITFTMENAGDTGLKLLDIKLRIN